MVLSIIAAAMSAIMFSISMPGVFVGTDRYHYEEEHVSRHIINSALNSIVVL